MSGSERPSSGWLHDGCSVLCFRLANPGNRTYCRYTIRYHVDGTPPKKTMHGTRAGREQQRLITAPTKIILHYDPTYSSFNRP